MEYLYLFVKHVILFQLLSSSYAFTPVLAGFRGGAFYRYELAQHHAPSLIYSTSCIRHELSMASDGDNPVDNEASSESSWISADPNDLTTGERYKLCISAFVPRPVAVITTQDNDGIINCAPFSFSSLSSFDPPILTHGICMTSRDGVPTKKDTLRNIEESKEWVVHLLTEHFLSQANACAANLAADKSEVETNGMTTQPSTVVSVPRLVNAPVAFECRLWDAKEVYNDDGAHTTTIVMGKVVHVHINEALLVKNNPDSPIVDLEKLHAVGRAGDITYWPVGVAEGNALAMERPS